MVAIDSRRAMRAAGAMLVAMMVAGAPATASAPAVPQCVDHRVADALSATRHSVFAIRCADFTGEGVRDVAYMKIADGERPRALVVEWGVVYSTGGGIEIARFTGHARYRNLRVRGRRVLIDSPILRPGGLLAPPTSGVRTEEARWNGTRFVRRLVRLDRAPPAVR